MGIWDDVKQGTLPTSNTATSAWKDIKQDRLTAADLLSPSPDKGVIKADNKLLPGTISFDLETGSVLDMWKTGPEFIRLTGYCRDNGDVWTTPSPQTLMDLINSYDGPVVSHNGLNYDLILLAKHHGLDLLKLAKQDRIIDTKLLAFLADPPLSRTKEGEIERMFSLDNTGLRYLGEGKVKDIVSGKSVLKELAKEFGGYDQIPQDHPQYVEYLKQDVIVTRELAKVIPMSDYTRREHKINAIASVISIGGFRVDVPLLEQRIKDGEEKKHRILTELMAYGLPGPGTSKAPHRTNAGIAAIDAAFTSLGVTLPRTEKTGRPALGKDVLLGVVEGTESQDVIDLAESVLGLNGIRSIYGNAYDNLVGDRVHPSINLRQSSGRLSFQRPGLSVFGKKLGRYHERDIFIAEPGEILVSCDLSQVDARAVGALSQDYEYLDLFEEGRDLHTEIAVRVWGSKDKRESAKILTHGWNYGMGVKKLALMANMSIEEADTFDYEMKKAFPRLVEWQHEVREEAELGILLDNGFGRKMRVDPDRVWTAAPALSGQGCARDILMEGLLNIWKNGGEAIVRMVKALIHDELICSVPEGDIDEIEKIIQDSLSFPWCPPWGSRAVNIEAGFAKRSKSWGGCYQK